MADHAVFRLRCPHCKTWNVRVDEFPVRKPTPATCVLPRCGKRVMVHPPRRGPLKGSTGPQAYALEFDPDADRPGWRARWVRFKAGWRAFLAFIKPLDWFQ